MTYLPAILPRPRRVTISQVAEAAGVARATAAFVISGRAPELRIAQKAIDRVNAVAKKLGYVPNQLARGMITGRSHVVGVILGGVWGKFGQYVIEAIEKPKLRPQERLIEAAELVVRSSTVGVAGSVR
ncbi:MAG: LacI family DNA-binding transcriptional regulator [Planctomycetia bacterium]|jgi:hypothetical protein